MKIGIISANTRLYSTRRLREACRKAGHDVRFLHPKKCAVRWTASGTSLAHGNLVIDGVEAVIPRIGSSLIHSGLVALRHFEYQGIPTANSAHSIALCRDKVACLQHLASHQIPIPPTVVVDAADQLEESVDQLGGFPLILKIAHGAQGIGVIKVGAMDQLRTTVETLWHLGEHLILQRFVEESEGRDLRLLVVGDRVIAAMERSSAEGDFRSNIHCGGTGRTFRPDEELTALAIEATRAVGLGVAGVDILMTRSGPAILEINSSPGLEGIESATGRNLARSIVRYTESLSAS